MVLYSKQSYVMYMGGEVPNTDFFGRIPGGIKKEKRFGKFSEQKYTNNFENT